MFFYFIQFGHRIYAPDTKRMQRFLPHINFKTFTAEFDNLHIFIAWRDNFFSTITKENLFSVLRDGLSTDGLKITFTQNEMKVNSSKMGDDFSCYWAENDKITVTNRLPLFYGAEGYSPKISETYLPWMLYEGYVGGVDTLFEGVQKVPAMSICTATLATTSVGFNVQKQFEAPAQQFETVDNQLIDEIASATTIARADILTDITENYSINFPISGGKDSRSCLAMLKGEELKIEKFWTRGTAYSSDVIAAKLVAQNTPLLNHSVVRPSYFSPEESQVKRVYSSIVNTQGMLSAYDFSGLSDERRHKRVMGRLIGLKGDCISPKNGDLRNILNWPMRENNLKYLTNTAFNLIQRNHLDYLNESLASKTDTPFANQLYDLFDVMIARSAFLIQIERLSGKLSYPLFQSKLLNISLKCPPSFTQKEVFHYLINHINWPELNDIPFADQQWDSSLPNFFSEHYPQLTKMAEKSCSTRPINSSKHFPNLSNPLVGNHKLNLILEFKEFLLRWISTLSSDVINKEKIQQDIEQCENSFISIFRLSGLLTASLILSYGSDFFDLNEKENILTELNKNRSKSFDGPSLESKITAYEQLLQRHEIAIAQIYCEANKLHI